MGADKHALAGKQHKTCTLQAKMRRLTANHVTQLYQFSRNEFLWNVAPSLMDRNCNQPTQ